MINPILGAMVIIFYIFSEENKYAINKRKKTTVEF